MGYYEKLIKLDKVYQALKDDESKTLFHLRVDYMITRDADAFHRGKDLLYNDWRCDELEQFVHDKEVKGIVICGSGYDRDTRRILRICGYENLYYCDVLDRGSAMPKECPEISVQELAEYFPGFIAVMAEKFERERVYSTLLSAGVPKESILSPRHKRLIGSTGKQYFDVFDPAENEIFVDAGAYDGGTTLQFAEWTNRQYKKIYVMEPLREMYESIEQKIQENHLHNVSVLERAAWDKEEVLYFKENDSGSKVAGDGTLAVKGADIDSIVGDSPVTFIKMDIEGSELKALAGARETILRNKPRLAVCIYHKPEDILEIPLYLLELIPDYKFYIRHYCSNMFETVLYAVP